MLQLVRHHCDCCHVSAAAESGCTLVLPRGGALICISGTAYQNNHGHPGALADHVVFWAREEDCVAVVELKSKRPSSRHAVKQLANAAKVAEEAIEGLGGEPRFAAAILHKGLDSIGKKAIGSNKVSFRGKRYRIQTKPCGTELSALYPA
jgi:hypothetical protein